MSDSILTYSAEIEQLSNALLELQRTHYDLIIRYTELEAGLNQVIASSHAYVLQKHKAGDENIHAAYRRIAQRALRIVK